MINKIVLSAAEAVADIRDGATVMIGGFGTAGMPSELIDALIEQGARDLTIVNNNAGNGDTGLAALLKAKRVRKIICSFPRQTDSLGLRRAVSRRRDRARARAAGQSGRAHSRRRRGHRRVLHARPATARCSPRARRRARSTADSYVLEHPIHADFALIKADRGDRWGNLVYRKTARNFGPIMASRSEVRDRAGARDRADLGGLDPETIVTPGIFVQRVVEAAGRRARRAAGSRTRTAEA